MLKTDLASDVYFLLLKHGFTALMAKFIAAQAAHETGNFTSLVFRENNNLFGMKQPVLRKTTAKGTKNGHAWYESTEDSVKDFDLYFKSFRYNQTYKTVNDYVEALYSKNYFQAPLSEYKTGVNHFYNLYFNGKQV